MSSNVVVHDKVIYEALDTIRRRKGHQAVYEYPEQKRCISYKVSLSPSFWTKHSVV